MISAKILGFEKLVGGNIKMNVEYTKADGKVVRNDYQLAIEHLLGKTQAEIEDWCLKQVDYQIDRYIEEHIEDTAQNKCKVTVDLKRAEWEANRDNNNDIFINNNLALLTGCTLSKDKMTVKLLETGKLMNAQQAQYTYKGSVVKEIDIDLDGNVIEKDV